MTTVANTTIEQSSSPDPSGGVVSTVVISACTVMMVYVIGATTWQIAGPFVKLVPQMVSSVTSAMC